MDINNIINSVVTDQLTKGASQKLGISQDKAQSVVNMAIPLLIGGLAKNAKDPQEAENISQAISKDHDGSILNELSTLILSDTKEEEGKKIVGHILGAKTVTASKVIGTQTQIDPQQVQQILGMVAPVIMGALGSKKNNGGLDGSTLSDFLQKTVNANKTSSPKQSNDLLSQILDQNKNGSVIDDIINIGMKLLRGLFSKK